MNKYRNEKGAALVLTLMIVTLILLFILTQFYQATNTAKQVNTVEHTIDARLVAEMGIDYYRSQIDQYKNEDSIETYTSDLSTRVQLDSKREFTITLSEIVSTDKEIILKVTSTGLAFDSKSTIKDELTINLP